MIGGDGERSVSLENPLWSGTTRVAIFMPAGVASGDIAQNYLLEPLSQAAATQLYRKDTKLTVCFAHRQSRFAAIQYGEYAVNGVAIRTFRADPRDRKSVV